MGIRDELQADIAEAFDGDLADAVGTITLTGTVQGEYDPVTGTIPEVTQDYTARGVFSGYDRQEVDGQHVLATDIKVTILQNEFFDEAGNRAVPKVGFTIIRGTKNSWFYWFFKYSEFATFRVLQVLQDPVAATWTIQLREK